MVCQFFILSLKAGGTGLNLTAASHVIQKPDRWWNPAVENLPPIAPSGIGLKRHVLVCQIRLPRYSGGQDR